jgi:hypothetical protein
MLTADRTPEAEPTPTAAAPKSKAAFTVGSQGETVDNARMAAKPTDNEAAGEPAASATPAATATREVKSGSADAGPAGNATREAKPGSAGPAPAKPAETATSAQHDDKPPAARDSETGQQRQVTVVPGVPRYHTDNCILIRFMGDDDMQQMSLKAATDAGCTPCGACQPGN